MMTLTRMVQSLRGHIARARRPVGPFALPFRDARMPCCVRDVRAPAGPCSRAINYLRRRRRIGGQAAAGGRHRPRASRAAGPRCDGRKPPVDHSSWTAGEEGRKLARKRKSMEKRHARTRSYIIAANSAAGAPLKPDAADATQLSSSVASASAV